MLFTNRAELMLLRGAHADLLTRRDTRLFYSEKNGPRCRIVR